MKRASLLLSGILVLGVALVIGTAQARTGSTSVHKASYQVVSIDADANTITLKDEHGEKTTSPVLPDAVEKLASLKQGMKVIVSCRDNDDGEHEGIVAIEIVTADEAADAKTTHRETYEVVSVDLMSQTITLKDEDGNEFTSKVMGKALEKLENVEVGMKITTTCQDNKKKEHEGIVDIEILN